MALPHRDSFLSHLKDALSQGSFVKLTLGAPVKRDSDLKNLFVRPVVLKSGPQLCLVWRHQTRDITKNLPPSEAQVQITALLGSDFLDAHLFTTDGTIEYRTLPEGKELLRIRKATTPSAPPTPPAAPDHNNKKAYLIAPDSGWLRRLSVTNARGEPRSEMSAKFRQIQKFAELLQHLVGEATLTGSVEKPLRVADMGCGKGYLTFAAAALLGSTSRVTGIELRPELCSQCTEIAQEEGLPWLDFQPGSIADAKLESPDVVIALHACDTATDDAIARGISAGARLILLSPCCHKEVRPQLNPPDVMKDSLRHGILQERTAEILTDALRAELLEWAGYRTRVFEFISSEHTSKNLMISAVRVRDAKDEARALRIRDLASTFGIRHHHLATLLGFSLEA